MNAVEVRNLRKVYGTKVAVNNISFDVEAGEVFGMVGPNGAGKTTTIECIEGLRRQTSGTVRVLGMDPVYERNALQQRVGVQLQQSSLQKRLKVKEALQLFSDLYPNPAPWQPIAERLGLSASLNTHFGALSGGQRQRLNIALALIPNPEIVFFDELTTGLDPQARRVMWDLVQDLHREGKTVFLTTHLMDEAERLCDRVAIIDHGDIVALDTPQNLISTVDVETRVLLTVPEEVLIEALARVRTVPHAIRAESEGSEIVVHGSGDALPVEVVNALWEAGIEFTSLKVERPTLEDVFLKLTGRTIRS